MTEPVVKRAPGRPKGSKSKQLTARQRAEAAALFSAGDASLEDLAKRYGKTASGMWQMLQKMGVKKDERKKEVEEEARKKIEDEILADSTILAAKIRTAKDESDRFYTTIRKLTLHEIVTAKKAGLPLSTIVNNLKALESAAKIARVTQEGQFQVLGISTEPVEIEEDLPELKISGLSQDELDALNKQSFQNPDALDDDDFDEPDDEDSDDEGESVSDDDTDA